MSERFEKMERCARLGHEQGDASLQELLSLLADAAWQVRYAAAIALGDRRAESAVDALLQQLSAEDAAPIYGQQADLGGAPAGSPYASALRFPEGTTAETQEAWRRRGRLKQAVVLALGNIGVADPRVLNALHRYVTDNAEDYMVRAAAGKALGMLADPSSRPFLEQAVNGDEFCARTEASKALQRVI